MWSNTNESGTNRVFRYFNNIFSVHNSRQYMSDFHLALAFFGMVCVISAVLVSLVYSVEGDE